MRRFLAALLLLIAGQAAAQQPAVVTEARVELVNAVKLESGTSVQLRARLQGVELIGSGAVTAVEGGRRLRITWHSTANPSRYLVSPLMSQIRTAATTLAAGTALTARGDVSATLDRSLDPIPSVPAMSAVERQWLGCPEYVNLNRGVAVVQTRSVELTGPKPKWGACVPDLMAGVAPVIADSQGCDWFVDIDRQIARRGVRHIYTMGGRTIEALPCTIREGSEERPLVETTLFCPYEHRVAQGQSTVAKRLAFQPNPAEAAWRGIIPCMATSVVVLPLNRVSCGRPTGFQMVRWEVTDPGTRRTRTVIDCQPAPEVNGSLQAEACTRPTLFHDDPGWVSFEGRRIIRERHSENGSTEVVADCVADPAKPVPQDARVVGWEHKDGLLMSVPLYQRFAAGGGMTVDRGGPFPADPPRPYRLVEKRTASGQAQTLGCVEFVPGDTIEVYARADGSHYERRQGWTEPQIINRCQPSR